MFRRLSIVFALLTALATVIVAVAGSYASYVKQLGVDEAAARDRGDRSSSMLARVVTQSVADYDLTTMEQHLDSALKDPEVLKLEILDAKDSTIVEKSKSTPEADDWVFVKDVDRDGQKVGSLKLSFSSKRFLEASRSALERAAVLTLATVLVIVSLISFLFKYLIGTRLSQLVNLCVAAEKGHLDARAVSGRDDELGTVANAFNAMIASIEAKSAELAAINGSLERLVAERTATITTIVDNVRSGIFLMDKDLVIQDGLTRSCQTLLGSGARAGVTVPQALRLNARDATQFDLCAHEVFEDIMPEEVTLDQIPRRFEIDGRVVKLEGAVVRDGAVVKNILFTVNDVTQLEKAERANLLSQAIIKILGQRDAFVAFLSDFRSASSQCLHWAEDQTCQPRIRAALHTMKGNSAAFGLKDIAAIIHEIEDKTAIDAKDISAVDAAMRSFLLANSRVLNLALDGEPRETLIIEKAHVESLQSALDKEENRENILTLTRKWLREVKMKRASDMFGPLDDLVNGLASRLEKRVRLVIEGGDTLVDPDRIAPIVQNLSHIIRNCIDHGIEGPGERVGKPETATIFIRVSAEKSGWMLKIGDDGRGVDVEKLKLKAVKLGFLERERVGQLSTAYALDLIFRDGLSTADSISDISGRGVGLAAVRNAVKLANGRIDVSTEKGKGTEFTIWVPDDASLQQKAA